MKYTESVAVFVCVCVCVCGSHTHATKYQKAAYIYAAKETQMSNTDALAWP